MEVEGLTGSREDERGGDRIKYALSIICKPFWHRSCVLVFLIIIYLHLAHGFWFLAMYVVSMNDLFGHSFLPYLDSTFHVFFHKYIYVQYSE